MADEVGKWIAGIPGACPRRPPRWVGLCVAWAAAVCGAAGPYQEAPMLRELVEAGRLPPVEERLPDEPAVIEPVREIGRYGGTWRRLAITPQDSLLSNRLGYEPLVRWDRSGVRPTPGLAKSWNIENGGRRYILYLRKGIRWSDGQPFTSADVLYWFEDVATNKQLGGTYIAMAPKDTVLRVSAPDPLTIVFDFDKPNGIFLEKLCYRGHFIYAPKHYMTQFHLKYTDRAKLDEMAAEAGYDHWAHLYLNRADPSANPERPTLAPWLLETGPPAMMYVAVRNPYYWKVDPAGNQLPYIDRVSHQVVDNEEVLNLIASTGEVDMQGRHIEPSKYTLFMLPEHRKRGGVVRYRVLGDPGPGGNVGVLLNHSTQNPRLRPYITDRRFRIALSVAIHRPEVLELITGGLGDSINGVGFPTDRFFVTGMDKRHTQYDPELACKLLDEVGLQRGPDGMRRFPDGRRFREIIYCATAGTAGELDMEQLVAQYWREVGLEFVLKSEPTDITYMRGRNGEFDFLFLGQAGLHWILQPALYVPIKDICYTASLYGRYVQTEGKAGVPPTPEFQRLIDWYYELVHTVGDDRRQLELGRNILWQWANECYMIGLYRQHVLAVVSSRFRNCPDHILHGWRVQFPGYMQPEQFWIESREHPVRAEAGPGGRIYPAGQFKVYHGMEQEFAVTPDEGYVVADLRVDGQSVGAARSHRVGRVTAGLTVEVTFKRGAP